MLTQLVADVCPSSASFFGFMGVSTAIIFATKSGVCIASIGVMRPELAMRNIIPVVMGSIDPPNGNTPMYGSYPGSYSGFAQLAAGLCCGLSGLAAGMAIGVVGDAGVRAERHQEKLFVNMILILIFAEALGLYGLIVALILSQKKSDCPSE
ncbi:hypothetical protein PsorP6_017468 [Peronosclerospora sorghi]|uniref:Uncharacterized protein n=1 Tax=Peronosclerospora sorghi TaxID=230839 RepID=A0ACC0WNZ1_9STRA|nr:hypothetical protein PsorP6_017468 [Peronosclerospora sorghi]